MKIVFFGTPDFAGKVLLSLINSSHQVVGVVTQEDKKVGRKQILTESPVKVIANENNINVFQFHKIRSEGYSELKNLNADIFITCAYGQIISEEILNLPKYGTINIHFSLLPLYRGASPVQWALINGESETGVTIMRTDAGIDTGDIIIQKSLKIDSEDNTETLLYKLTDLSLPILSKVLQDFASNNIKFIKQGENFTYYPILKKEDGLIDFNKTSLEIINKIKGLSVWPGVYFYYNNKIVKVFNAESVNFESKEENGTIVCANKTGLIVKCKNSYLKILELQMEGAKRLFYKDFLNGNKIQVGDKLNGNLT